MKLKAKLSQEEYDALGEAQREFYVPGKDGYLLDAEGVEDVSGLKSSLEKQRKEVRELKAALQEKADQYKDIDPEAAREALAKIRKLDEKSLLDEGKIEELFKQRLTPIQRDHQAQLDALQKDLKLREDKLATLTKKLSETSLTAQVAEAATKARVDPDWLDYVNLKAQQQWNLDPETHELMPFSGDRVLYGKDGKPMDMDEWISGLAKDKPKMLLPNTGAGANGSNGRPTNGAITVTRADMKDTRKFEAVMKQAKDAGIPMSAIQITE